MKNGPLAYGPFFIFTPAYSLINVIKLRELALPLTPSHWEGEPYFPPLGGIEGGPALRKSTNLMTLIL
jgi:hypothetical protein